MKEHIDTTPIQFWGLVILLLLSSVGIWIIGFLTIIDWISS